MPVTYEQAKDEVFGVVNAGVQAANAIVGYDIEVRWPGNPEPSLPPQDEIWARVSTKTVMESQRSLANFEGKRRYEAHCLLYVQVFCPRSVVGILESGIKVAQAIRSELRSWQGNVIFRNEQICELDTTEEHYPINVVAEFVFDTVE
jgi:hypothetical protein